MVEVAIWCGFEGIGMVLGRGGTEERVVSRPARVTGWTHYGLTVNGDSIFYVPRVLARDGLVLYFLSSAFVPSLFFTHYPSGCVIFTSSIKNSPHVVLHCWFSPYTCSFRNIIWVSLIIHRRPLLCTESQHYQLRCSNNSKQKSESGGVLGR